MRPRLLHALVIFAGLLLTGCFPESTNPLSTPATSTIDPRLEGVYVAHHDKTDDSLNIYHIHYRGERHETGGPPLVTPWLEILNINHSKGKPLEGVAYRALTTHLGAHDYMSVLELGSVTSSENGLAKPAQAENARLYWIARYEIDGAGMLRVWMMSTKAWEEAINAGKIRGQVKPHKEGDDVLVADSTENLAKFVTKGDPAILFGGKPLVLYRLAR
jgi:hypothetical protein